MSSAFHIPHSTFCWVDPRAAPRYIRVVKPIALIGPYEDLGQAYDWLHEWIHGQGREEGPAPWESYASDPSSTSQEDLRTELYWPLA